MKRSLHIGLNGVDPDRYNGWPGELYGCVNDARCLAALCAQHGFSAAAVLDEEATLKHIRAAFTDLAREAVAGDTVVLSFSGHGGRSGSWTWTGYTETLCFHDGMMADTEFRSLLEKFAAGVNVVAILDACHSGGMDRAAQVIGRGGASVLASRIRFKPHFVRAAEPQILPERAPLAASVLLLTACRADETALDGVSNGAFTGSLLRAREEFPNESVPTWLAWHRATAALMLKEFAPQHPQAIALGADRVFHQRLTA